MATVVTAECEDFWRLLVCQGFLTGMSCGMIFGPIPTILSQWFKKRRSLAFGISATGSSLGGTIIPIVSSNLIDLIGCVKSIRIDNNYQQGCFRFKWTMRVVALIVFVMLAIANLVTIHPSSTFAMFITAPLQTLRRRLDPPRDPGPFLTLQDFRKPAFTVFIAAGVFSLLGLYTRKLRSFHTAVARLTWSHQQS